jgi:hypothetical protein
MHHLSAEDRTQYEQLKTYVGSPDVKYARFQKHNVFLEIMRRVISFCHHREVDKANRYVACGICPISGGVAVNTHQLALLLNRSKSAVNALLAEVGFVTIPISGNHMDELNRMTHVLIGSELRRWTIRQFSTTKTIIPITQVHQPVAKPSEDKFLSNTFESGFLDHENPWDLSFDF